MTEKIPYWKSSRALQAFFPRTGEEGCRLCTDDSIRLSLDRAPPPMRDAPLAAKPVAAKGRRRKPEDIVDKTLNVIEAIATGVEQWRKFQKWMETAAPVQPKVLKTAASKTDAQGTVRHPAHTGHRSQAGNVACGEDLRKVV